MNDLATQGEFQLANPAQLYMDPAKLQSMVTFADMMSKSSITVPDHLRNKPSDCLAIVMQSTRWGMDPFVVAQKTHLVSGKLGYEAQLVIAVLQSSNAIRGRFHYEYTGTGNDLACRVGAIPAGESEIVWGSWLRLADVKVQNSPLWKTNPQQQIGYLQAKNWARLFAPGAILGVYTPDELDDGRSASATAAAGPAEQINPDGSTTPLMPARRASAPTQPPAPTPAPPPPADGGLFEEATVVGAPAPAPTTQTKAEPIPGDTGELASDGHKNNLRQKAKAKNLDLDAVLATLGFNLNALTLAQFAVARSTLNDA